MFTAPIATTVLATWAAGQLPDAPAEYFASLCKELIDRRQAANTLRIETAAMCLPGLVAQGYVHDHAAATALGYADALIRTAAGSQC